MPYQPTAPVQKEETDALYKDLIRDRIARVANADLLAARLRGGSGVATECGDWRVKLGTSAALARLGAKDATCAPEVRSLLFDGRDEVKRLAVVALSESNEACVPKQLNPHATDLCSLPPVVQEVTLRLRLLLGSADWRLRRGAVEAIGRQGSAALDHTAVIAALLVDEVPSVRAAAATALKNMGSTTAPFIADILCAANEKRCPEARALLEHFAAGNLARVEAYVRDAKTRSWGTQESPSAVIIGGPFSELELDEAKKKVKDAFISMVPPARTEVPVLVVQQTLKMDSTTPVHADDSAILRESQQLQARVLELEEHVQLLTQGRQPAPPQGLPSPSNPRHSIAKKEMQAEKMQASSRIQHGASAAQLVELLGEIQSHVRHSALVALASMSVAEVLPFADAISSSLEDEDAQVRAAAAGCLGHLGKDAAANAEALVGKLVDSYSFVKQAALRALGAVGAKDHAFAMGRLLEDDDPVVRLEAALALGSLGPSATGPAAAHALCHADARIRTAAKKAFLVAVGFSTIAVEPSDVCSASENLQRSATAALKSAEASDVLKSHLLPLLTESSPEVRIDVAELLERLGATKNEEVEAQCRAAVLEDQQADVRENALRRLGELGSAVSADVAAVMARCLADPSDAVRKAAAHSLVVLGDPNGLGAALGAAGLLEHPLQTVRRAASTALAGMGEAVHEHEVARQLALLPDSSPTVRANAVEALGQLCNSAEPISPTHVAAIAALHIDQHWCVRRAVVDALRRCGQAAASQAVPLHQLTKDGDWRVSEAATNLVKELNLPPPVLQLPEKQSKRWDEPLGPRGSQSLALENHTGLGSKLQNAVPPNAAKVTLVEKPAKVRSEQDQPHMEESEVALATSLERTSIVLERNPPTPERGVLEHAKTADAFRMRDSTAMRNDDTRCTCNSMKDNVFGNAFLSEGSDAEQWQQAAAIHMQGLRQQTSSDNIALSERAPRDNTHHEEHSSCRRSAESQKTRHSHHHMQEDESCDGYQHKGGGRKGSKRRTGADGHRDKHEKASDGNQHHGHHHKHREDSDGQHHHHKHAEDIDGNHHHKARDESEGRHHHRHKYHTDRHHSSRHTEDGDGNHHHKQKHRHSDEGAEDERLRDQSTPPSQFTRKQSKEFSRKTSKKVNSRVEKRSSSETPLSGSNSQEVCPCGNVFLADAVFCRKCGQRRRDIAGDQQSSTYTSSSEKHVEPRRRSGSIGIVAELQQRTDRNAEALRRRSRTEAELSRS